MRSSIMQNQVIPERTILAESCAALLDQTFEDPVYSAI